VIPFASSWFFLEAAVMAQRRIGQETFRFGATAERQTSLDALAALIDWPRADLVLAPLYPAVKGEKAWPPLAMFKALLLATWYDLSDVALAESLSLTGRASAAFAVLRAQGHLSAIAYRDCFAHRCDGDGSASKGDKDAAWARHRTRAPAHGYKAHIAADKDSGLIRKVETTPANEADVSIAPAIIPDEPGEVYADRAYDALSVEKAIIAAGGTARLLRKGHRFLPAEALEAHNRPLRPIRSRIEKIFGTWKRSYHFRRMRWLGLAKAKLQVHLAAIAYNVKRSWRMQAA
jgi:transposase, IS5 family